MITWLRGGMHTVEFFFLFEYLGEIEFENNLPF